MAGGLHVEEAQHRSDEEDAKHKSHTDTTGLWKSV